MADSGKLVKMEVDYSKAVDKMLPECQELVKDGKVTEALDKLLALEKQTRLAADAMSTARLLKAIVQLCFDLGDWDGLGEHIVLLSKRRSQLKTAVAAMVEECCKYVDQTPNMETKLKLIDTLRTVTEGKIYVEVPRARLTLELARIKENEGDIASAANILQELQVETYGSMERDEKVQFIVEQMRLCIARRDFIRAQIVSKKISTKFFFNESEVIQELKLRYYRLMVELGQHDSNYLAICQHYRAMFDTPLLQQDAEAWKDALKNSVLYVLLAPYDNEQSDLLHRVYEEKKLEELPAYKELLECFHRRELLDWETVRATYEPVLREGTADCPVTSVFSEGEGETRWQDFRKRVIEHNIRVVAMYYTRVTVQRLSELLLLSDQEVELFLSDLVTKKTVYARIDRPAGIISFRQVQDPSEVLNSWSENLNSLMSLVSRTTHLINKEEMVHRLF